MTDPSNDPVGTVRREEHKDGYSIWVRVGRSKIEGYGSNAVVFVKPEWRCVYSTANGNPGATFNELPDFPVIGAVPGTPAAEPDAADDEVAVERIARTLHRGAWERDIANGTPLEGNDVDVCWSKVGAKYREWYYADARAALAALRGDQS